MQYLLYEPKPAWGDITPLGIAGRIAFAREFCFLVRLLHDRHLVIGDISMSNLLWSDGDPPGVFLLGCDGIRLLGAPPVLRQAETPDWTDPKAPQSGLDLDSDRYKLALVIGRVLTRTADLHPGTELPSLSGVPDRVARQVTELWRQAAGERGIRPDAQHWLMALSERGEITLPVPPPVRKRPAIPLAELDDSIARRGSIHFHGPSPGSG